MMAKVPVVLIVKLVEIAVSIFLAWRKSRDEKRKSKKKVPNSGT